MSTSSTTERPQLKLVPHFELPQLKFPAPLQALRRAAWKGHGAILPLLHATDPVRPKNTCLNLHILWLKALAGTRGETDDHLSYRLLPKKSRWLISRPFCWLYPPWHHDTVARRTLFIEQEIANIVKASAVPARSLHFVTLGAGFDTRPLRIGVVENPIRRRATYDERLSWAEIDQPEVTEEKRRLVQRLTRRRPWLARCVPRAYSGDLSTARGRRVVRRAARTASGPMGQGDGPIFVVEALLMYLPESSAMELLRVCGSIRGARIVFADRLPCGVENRAEAKELLERLGWTLITWQINAKQVRRKDTRTDGHQRGVVVDDSGDARALAASGALVSSARHMGVAHVSASGLPRA